MISKNQAIALFAVVLSVNLTPLSFAQADSNKEESFFEFLVNFISYRPTYSRQGDNKHKKISQSNSQTKGLLAGSDLNTKSAEEFSINSKIKNSLPSSEMTCPKQKFKLGDLVIDLPNSKTLEDPNSSNPEDIIGASKTCRDIYFKDSSIELSKPSDPVNIVCKLGRWTQVGSCMRNLPQVCVNTDDGPICDTKNCEAGEAPVYTGSTTFLKLDKSLHETTQFFSCDGLKSYSADEAQGSEAFGVTCSKGIFRVTHDYCGKQSTEKAKEGNCPRSTHRLVAGTYIDSNGSQIKAKACALKKINITYDCEISGSKNTQCISSSGWDWIQFEDSEKSISCNGSSCRGDEDANFAESKYGVSRTNQSLNCSSGQVITLDGSVKLGRYKLSSACYPSQVSSSSSDLSTIPFYEAIISSGWMKGYRVVCNDGIYNKYNSKIANPNIKIPDCPQISQNTVADSSSSVGSSDQDSSVREPAETK